MYNPYLLEFVVKERTGELKTIRPDRSISIFQKLESMPVIDYFENSSYTGFVQDRPVLSTSFRWNWKDALDILLIILASLGLVGLLAFLTS